jgi:type I restriction enzyme M protein
MVSKLKPVDEGGGRMAIIMNGSPLFTGDAGSGESEIRRWLLENDWLEAIVALPSQLFYNTGINTYIWVLTNRKEERRRGKVLLVNGAATEKTGNGGEAEVFARKMRKSLGDKRNELAPEHVDALARLAAAAKEGPYCKVFDTADFGYRKITVERPLRLNFQVSPERLERLKAAPAFVALATSKKRDAGSAEAEVEAGKARQNALLRALEGLSTDRLYKDRDTFVHEIKRVFKDAEVSVSAPLFKAVLAALSERDETAEICRDAKGNPEPDPDLRDTENVPLKEDIQTYFEREVLPHVPDAWINETVRDEKDGQVGKVGYEINFNRYFYRYEPPRPLAEIDADIRRLEAEIADMLREVTNQ